MPPPKLLLIAIALVQASHSRVRVKFIEYISQLNELKRFSREATGTDLLFETSYNHVRGDTCKQCDKRRLVERKLRNTESVVHMVPLTCPLDSIWIAFFSSMIWGCI